MIAQLALMPDKRSMRRIDLVTVLTVAVFVGLGVFAGTQLWDLARLTGSMLTAADAIDETSRGIGLLARVPLVGDAAARLSDSVAATGGSVRANAISSMGTIRTLAVVLALAVALTPTLPAITVYLPLRLVRHRQLRALRRLVAAPRPEPVLVEQLAWHAVARLPLGDLRRVSREPWLDLARGRHLPLAAAELRRLGLTAPPDWLGERPPDPPGRFDRR